LSNLSNLLRRYFSNFLPHIQQEVKMQQSLQLVSPKFIPPLEPEFRPAALANRQFRAAAAGVGVPLILGLGTRPRRSFTF